MKEHDQSLPGSCLSQIGCTECGPREGFNPEGICFAPPSALADGCYWYYEKPGLWAIGIMDIVLKEDMTMEFQQPEYISLDYWDTISAEELSPYKRINANTMRGHVSKGELFRARYHRNIPIRGIELMLMPGYYRDCLERRWPGEFPSATEAFGSIDGITYFPEMVLLLRQIRGFMGTGAAAELFYESKIAEAVSLIIEKTREKRTRERSSPLSETDIGNLETVRSWIEDHSAFDLRAEDLAGIACMGQTKLRASFRERFGCTITEYIQQKRVANAEYMLTATDFPIAQIAEAVGYRHAGRFASLFRRHTGFFPEEYRNLNRK